MTESPRTEGEEATTAEPMPSIAEVAAWLRRAAEQRDDIEDLRPAPRASTPSTPSTPAASPGGDGPLGGGHVAPGDEPAGWMAVPEQDSKGEIAVAGGVDETRFDDVPVVRSDDRAADEEVSTPEEATAGDAQHGVEASLDPAAEEPSGYVDGLGRLGTPPTEEDSLTGEPSTPEVPVVEGVLDEGMPRDAVEQASPEQASPEQASPEQASPEQASAEQASAEQASADGVTAVAGQANDEGLTAGEDAWVGPQPAEPPSGGAASPEGSSPGLAGRPVAQLDFAAQGDQPPARGSEGGGERPAVEVGGAEPASGPDERLGDAEASASAEAGLTDGGSRSSSTTAGTDPAATRGIVTEGPPHASVDEAGTDVPQAQALIGDHLEGVPDADAASAAADHEPGPMPGLQALSASGSSVASLFDLDLAELAARARASAEARMASIAPPASTHDAATATDSQTHLAPDADTGAPAPQPTHSGTSIDLAVADALDVEDELDVGGRRSVVPAPPEGKRDAPFDHTRSSEVDDDDDGAVVDLRHGDVDEAADAHPEATTTASSLAGTPTARLQARRAKGKRYPRGQLKEQIGILRRVRAMLGVVVLTVVLGVAAGAAIGAFLFFLAFAIRGAITSG